MIFFMSVSVECDRISSTLWEFGLISLILIVDSFSVCVDRAEPFHSLLCITLMDFGRMVMRVGVDFMEGNLSSWSWDDTKKKGCSFPMFVLNILVFSLANSDDPRGIVAVGVYIPDVKECCRI